MLIVSGALKMPRKLLQVVGFWFADADLAVATGKPVAGRDSNLVR